MSKNIRGITIEIGAVTTGLDKALQDVNSKSRDINKELRDVNRLLKFNPKDTELLSQKQKLLGDQVSATKEKLDKLKQAESQVQEQFKKGEITEEQYRAYQREIVETTSKLKHYENQLKEVNREHNVFGEKMQEVGGKLTKAGEKMEGAGKGLSKKLTAPILGVVAASSKLGIDFEKSMSEVQAVTGATAEEMEQLEKSAREAGSTTDKSARDAADALKYMGLAGWDVETSQKALMPILKLSSAANIELGRTSDLVTDSMSSMGVAIDDLDEYLNVIALTQSKANTSADGMMEAYVKAGGTFKNMNVSLDESAAMLGILANRGLKGAEAGNSLNSVMVNLSGSTDKTREIFEELGIEIYDQQGSYIGLEETLLALSDKFDGMTESEKNYYMAQLVGKTQIDTMTKLLDGLGSEYYDLKGEIQGAEGALEEMYETATDNTMGAINNLTSAIEELGLKVFDSAQPAIEKLTDVTQKLTDGFNNLSPEAQENIVKIGLLAAAIGPLLIVGGKLSKGIGNVIGLGGKLVDNWDKIKGAGSLLSSGLGKTVGFIFSPTGAIIAGIAAAIAIGVALYKNWDTIIEKAGNLKDNVVQRFEDIKKGITDKINNARDAVGNAIDKIKGFFDFEWSLPPLKLPRISMTGKFSLSPPQVPSFGIEWRKEGAIFTKPYVFGNQGWGEAGPEAVLPIEKLGGIMAETLDRMGITNNYNGGNIIVENMNVRNDGDIKRIANELYNLQQRNSRGRGIR